MHTDRCNSCGSGDGPPVVSLGGNEPLDVLQEHRHLSVPLRPLKVRLADVDDDIRPLYTTIRRQAADWVEAFADFWPCGPVRIYVEFCDWTCLVADSGGMPPRGRERKGDFPARAIVGDHGPEQQAWACLLAGATRGRNQRPRVTGPCRQDYLLRDDDILDWPALTEILGESSEPYRDWPNHECLAVAARIIGLLPVEIRAALASLAKRKGAVPDAGLGARVLAALNAMIGGADLIDGGPNPLSSGIGLARSLRQIDRGPLPAHERARLNRYLLEIGFLKLGRIPPGGHLDEVIARAPLGPFSGDNLIAVPIYAPKPSRLNGMVCLYGEGGPDFDREAAADRVLRLVDRLVAVPLNTQLALLECGFRVGQTDFHDEVVEVVFHLARKYVGSNDSCLRVLSGDKTKMFSCKSDCQYHDREFGTSIPRSREERTVEISSRAGTVGDNLRSDRDGEIVGRLLSDKRHLEAAEEAGLEPDVFRDESALLIRTTMGERPGIAALHHIARDFYDPADFVLLKAMLRSAEMRANELIRDRYVDKFLGSQKSSGELQAVLKQGLLWDNRIAIVRIIEDRLARDKLPGIAGIALVSGDLSEVLEELQPDEGIEPLYRDSRFRGLANHEINGFEYPRAVWVREGEESLWVDTSYDLSESKQSGALSNQELHRPAARSSCVVVVPIPGESFGQIWVEWRGPIKPEASPFSDRELVNLGKAGSEVAEYLEGAWGWKTAADAGRGATADIVDHNLRHVHLAAQRQLADFKRQLGPIDPGTTEILHRFESLFLEIRDRARKLAGVVERRDLQPVDVNYWLKHVYDKLALRAHIFGVSLKPVIYGPEARVSLDLELIDAAVLEIFMNACEAMEVQEGERLFFIEARIEPTRVKIKLGDNGPGIAKDHWPHLFKHDFAVHARREGQRGLGLYAAHMYVELNQGRLQPCDSPYGRGACFEMVFNNVGVV